MLRHVITCCALLLAVLFGCSRQQEGTTPPLRPSAPGQPKRTEQGVIQIAKELAEIEGYALKDYQEPKAKFDPKLRQWWVSFDHKPPQPPGGHFSVNVDDRTGGPKLMKGE